MTTLTWQTCVQTRSLVGHDSTPFRRCFNLRKADGNDYSTELDNLIEDVEPIPEKYGEFVEMVHVTYIRYITRGCRTNYIPSLSDESKRLYAKYKQQYISDPSDNGIIETGNALMKT